MSVRLGIVVVLACVVVGSAPAAAEPKHTLYVEALGKGGLWGAGYDYQLSKRFAAGVVGSYYMLGGDQFSTLSPYLAAYPVIRDAHRWFIQLGPQIVHRATPSPVKEWDGMSTTGVAGEVSSGYEYRRGVLVRVYAMVSYGVNFAPGMGISLGWSR